MCAEKHTWKALCFLCVLEWEWVPQLTSWGASVWILCFAFIPTANAEKHRFFSTELPRESYLPTHFPSVTAFLDTCHSLLPVSPSHLFLTLHLTTNCDNIILDMLILTEPCNALWVDVRIMHDLRACPNKHASDYKSLGDWIVLWVPHVNKQMQTEILIIRLQSWW